MNVVCLDLEGVLIPEIWINVAERTQLGELRLTTRDIPDFHQLMSRRLEILDEHGIRIEDIHAVIGAMEPLAGALAFIRRLRSRRSVIILSDTFTQFVEPLMAKLEWPVLFCNELAIEPDGRISGYRLRQEDGKRRAVEALQSINLTVTAAGDSYNDLSMLRTADRAAWFRAPGSILAEHPDLPAFNSYDELLAFTDDAAE